MNAGTGPGEMPEEVFRALKRLMVEYADAVDTRGCLLYTSDAADE